MQVQLRAHSLVRGGILMQSSQDDQCSLMLQNAMCLTVPWLAAAAA